MTWGIVPAAGSGTRIQPLAFSKELLPVGSLRDESGVERPRAVSEYLVERLILGGARKLCFVISPGKSDILRYYGGATAGADIAYAVQDEPSGLCDAIFRALPLIAPGEAVLVGLPDTVWFPERALAGLPDDRLTFLLFPVARPSLFDSVETDATGTVTHIAVKSAEARSPWVWGAFKLTGAILADLHALWIGRGRADIYFGDLVNAWLARGNRAEAVRTGASYVDVGTVDGYRQALALLASPRAPVLPLIPRRARA